jgi:pimeloyl-ACP methyl ester carboxylesterase
VGRGYSDGPADITYNMTLFISQLCFLLASLPEWSGSFDLIGFSMGGAIATTFASYFPHRIDSLLLIAPSGLIQTKKLPWLLRAFLSDLIPLSLTSSLIFNGIIPIKFLHVTDMVDWQIKNHKGYIHSYTVRISRL